MNRRTAGLAKAAFVVIGALWLISPILRPELSNSLKLTALIGGAVFFVSAWVVDLEFRISKLERKGLRGVQDG